MTDKIFKGNGVHLVHLNIRSLFCKNKFDMFKEQTSNCNADVFCISETWLRNSLPSSIINIPGYKLSRIDRSWQENNMIKKGGGLCMYVNENLNTTDSDVQKFNLSSKDIEIQWITLKYPKMRDIIIANVYRPPQGNVKQFCKYIKDCLENINNLSKIDIFILGDFNINILKKSAEDTKDILNLMSSFGIKQFINEPTRFGRTNSCIDLIFSNSDYIKESGTLNLNYSDHQAIFITKKKIKSRSEKISFKGRSYKNYKTKDFQELLNNDNWENLYNIKDVNLAWDFFIQKILNCLDILCPVKNFVISKYREKWMNRDLMELIIDKDIALKKAKKSRRVEDFEIAKKLKNETGKLVENAKINYLSTEFENAKGDPKNFWKNIYSIIPKSKLENNKETIHLKDEKGNNIDIENTSSFINDFFINIGPNLANKTSSSWEYFDVEENNQINDIKIENGKVHALVTDIDISKSSGIEFLSSKCLKEALLILNAQICYIFELSTSTCSFPEKWKIATVVPLFKGGVKEDVSNYRPISLLPVPGKILEKLIHDHIMSFFDTNNILCNKQNGFRPNHSTTNSIVDLTNDIYKEINDKNVTLAAFIDLKKAFDTVNHKILLEKLLYMGIRGKSLAWIENYLTNRFQKTISNNILSKPGKIKCGVPQGSILGPLFFLVYINDIKNILGNVGYQLYADDTVIYCSDKTYEGSQKKLQSVINKFISWCAKNALTINTKKSKIMAFGSKNKIKNFKNINIMINNETLSNTPTYKYLGVHLDQTLNYKYHLDNLSNVINHKSCSAKSENI